LTDAEVCAQTKKSELSELKKLLKAPIERPNAGDICSFIIAAQWMFCFSMLPIDIPKMIERYGLRPSRLSSGVLVKRAGP